MSGVSQPGVPEQFAENANRSPRPETIPDEQREAMLRICDAMADVVDRMSGEEIALAMQGFYATSDTNCPWYAFALRWAMPPLLATFGSARPGYFEAFQAPALQEKQP